MGLHTTYHLHEHIAGWSGGRGVGLVEVKREGVVLSSNVNLAQWHSKIMLLMTQRKHQPTNSATGYPRLQVQVSVSFIINQWNPLSSQYSENWRHIEVSIN